MASALPPSSGERLIRQNEVGRRKQKHHAWGERMIDLFFPEQATCPLCGFAFAHEAKGWSKVHLCDRCARGCEEIVGGVCRICGRPDAGPVCRECEQADHLFVTARAYGRYHGVIEASIKGYKYQGIEALLPVLGEWATEAYLRYYGEDRSVRLVPVPMHPIKQANRGFNQSEQLAKYICRELKLPYVNILKRVRAGDSQAMRKRKERGYAKENPFAVRESQEPIEIRPRRLRQEENPIAGQTVLLVDDVLTTGSTADACAEVLYQLKAIAVHVLTVAR